MRISDWSSDVCSSDLLKRDQHRLAISGKRRFLLRGADVDLLADAPAVEEMGGEGGEEPARNDLAKPAQPERGRPDTAAEPERPIRRRVPRAVAGRGGPPPSSASQQGRTRGNGRGRATSRDLHLTPGGRRPT